jgi:hypothetical protein
VVDEAGLRTVAGELSITRVVAVPLSTAMLAPTPPPMPTSSDAEIVAMVRFLGEFMHQGSPRALKAALPEPECLLRRLALRVGLQRRLGLHER